MTKGTNMSKKKKEVAAGIPKEFPATLTEREALAALEAQVAQIQARANAIGEDVKRRMMLPASAKLQFEPTRGQFGVFVVSIDEKV